MSKKWVDPDDAPRLTGEEIHRPDARWQIGRKDVTAEEGKAAFRAALRAGKTRVNIHLDNDVIAHYRAKAGERGYQTLINAALRQGMEADRIANQSATSSSLQEMGTALLSVQQALKEIQAVIVGVGSVSGTYLSQLRVLELRAQTHGDVVAPSTPRLETQSSNDLTLRELN